jgi:hypothetical protein
MHGASSKRSKRLEYREERDAIVQLWTQAGLGTDGTLSSINAEADSSGLEQALVPLPLPLALAIATLIFEHEATKQKPIDRAARLFVGFRPENEKYLDTIRPTVRQWDEVTKWFMKITHESYRSDNAINEAELKTKFDSFEIALIAISQKFFTTTDALDESWKKPTPEQINRATFLLSHGEHHRHFFDRLENPEWLAPLEEKEFFDSPPPPVRDEPRGTIAFPPWPELRYLARMAKIVPGAVSEVILRIPHTENIRIHEDLVDIALILPGELAAKIVPNAVGWIKAPYHIRLPDKLGALECS